VGFGIKFFRKLKDERERRYVMENTSYQLKGWQHGILYKKKVDQTIKRDSFSWKHKKVDLVFF
jgi:hypothetical protein